MTDIPEQPVDARAKVYPVTAVAGREPATVDDFIGATTVTVRDATGHHDLKGAGTRNGPAVQFREKQLSSAAEDMPVWEIIPQGEGGMGARPASSD